MKPRKKMRIEKKREKQAEGDAQKYINKQKKVKLPPADEPESSSEEENLDDLLADDEPQGTLPPAYLTSR
jgi:hypothetical protein